MAKKPNILFFHVDNLGYGELGCYGGGVLRGADTRRIDEVRAGRVPASELRAGSAVHSDP